MIKHWILLKILNRMDIKEVLSLALKLKFFDKKASGGAIKNEVMSNKDLTEE